MNARANRGSGNNNVKAYQSAKVWDSIDNTKKEGCQHNKISFKPDGKECKECGAKL